MSEEKPFVYAVCQYVRTKTVTSYKIGKILLNRYKKKKYIRVRVFILTF